MEQAGVVQLSATKYLLTDYTINKYSEEGYDVYEIIFPVPGDSESYGGLEDLAKEFADHIPDDTFTPAEIQNHLMRYKNEPREAVERAEEWMKGVLEEKEKQRKYAEEADEDDEE